MHLTLQLKNIVQLKPEFLVGHSIDNNLESHVLVVTSQSNSVIVTNKN